MTKQKELEARAAFLCLDYLKTILPPERIAAIGLEIEQEFLPYKTKGWRTRKKQVYRTDNIALVLERVLRYRTRAHANDREPGWSLLLNARIISKLDRDPLSKIVDPEQVQW